MNAKRNAGVLAALVVGSMALSACGSDDNTSVASGGATESASSGGEIACADGTLNGEGSSAQKNAVDQITADYIAKCTGATINYNPSGSGAGIKNFNAGQVDWAGSDSALNAEKGEVAGAQARCTDNPAWNLPMVTGPIALAYNVEGVDELVLNGETAAKVFKGDITKWNDPAIADLNDGVELPDTDIKVFFRSDESGTTENFTKYLAAAGNGVWTAPPAKAWSGTGEGKEKSAGVAEGVKSTADSITYVEWSYARDNDLGVAKVDNGSGAVELTGESAGKAVAVATQSGTGNDLALKLDYATQEPGAYPIVLVTYQIVCSKGLDPAKTELLKGFLGYYASEAAQTSLEEIGYAPLPAEVAGKVAAAVEAIA